jgi:hypothetical protein
MFTNELLKPVLESGIVTPDVERHVTDFINNTAKLEVPPSVGILIRNARLYSPVPRFMHVYTFYPPHDLVPQSVEDALVAEQADLYVRMHGVGNSRIYFHDLTAAAFQGIDHDANPVDFRKKLDKLVSKSNLQMMAFQATILLLN